MTQDPRNPAGQRGDEPRTDLPPTREPYDEDYFGTGEEERVVREREESPEAESSDDPAEKRTPKGENL